MNSTAIAATTTSQNNPSRISNNNVDWNPAINANGFNVNFGGNHSVIFDIGFEGITELDDFGNLDVNGFDQGTFVIENNTVGINNIID
jgi:hypothetical protein